MTATDIARRYLAAAFAQASIEGEGRDAVARAMLAAVVSAMLENRSVADVEAELRAAAENVDPETDYMFMRP